MPSLTHDTDTPGRAQNLAISRPHVAAAASILAEGGGHPLVADGVAAESCEQLCKRVEAKVKVLVTIYNKCIPSSHQPGVSCVTVTLGQI